MQRHRPAKSNPTRHFLANGLKPKVKTDYAITQPDGSEREHWLHPTKGWRSRRLREEKRT